MWYLTLNPLVYNRWAGEVGGGSRDSLYFSHLVVRAEWMLSVHGISLGMKVPFVFPMGSRFSLSDIRLGLKFVFSERNRIYFCGVLPAGRLSSKYPGVYTEYLRVLMSDSSHSLYARLRWNFTASSDSDEKSFYNKFVDRHAYRHIGGDILWAFRRGETGFVKIGAALDYPMSMGGFWGGINVGGGFFPFLEVSATYWPFKPRPHLFKVGLLVLIPSRQP